MTTRAEFILQAIALEGTPYHLHQCTAGVGIDCIHVPILAAKNAGLTSIPYEVPKADRGYSGRPDGNKLMRRLEEYLVPKPKGSQIPGDLLVFRLEDDPQHLAVLVNETQFVHAIVGGTVKRSDITARWINRLVRVFAVPEFA